MSSSKLFSTLACLLCMAPFAVAESPADKRPPRNDNRYSGPSLQTQKIEVVEGKSLNQWVPELKAADPYDRDRAVKAIAQFGEDGTLAVPDVLKCLQDRDGSVRVHAIVALRYLGIPPTQRTPVIKSLGNCLSSSNSQAVHRYEAVKTLLTLMQFRFGRLKGDERKVIPQLLRNINSSSTYELRELTIDALMAAGPDPKKGPDPRVTDALIYHATPFREPSISVRYKAIMAMGALTRPQDPKKLQQVIHVLKSPANFHSHNKIIRMWSHVSLMALEDKVYPKELKGIVALLKDDDNAIRIQAVSALGALRDKAHAHVGDICDMLKGEKDPNVLPVGAQVLGRMKNNGLGVINTLTKITELDERKYVPAVLAACNAFKELGINDPTAILALEKVLKHASLADYEKAMVRDFLDALKERNLGKGNGRQPVPANGR